MALCCMVMLSDMKAHAAGPKIAVCADPGGALAARVKRSGATLTEINSTTDISSYDGLLVPGGRDVDPSMYGEKPAGAMDYSKAFDQEQIKIIDKFVKAGKPILAVCRGSQIMNVYFGGTLYQDISGHRGSVNTYTVSGSILRNLCGSSQTVSCGHHQAVKRLGDGLVATMLTSGGIVEGYEHAYLPIIGIQWHPEVMSLSSEIVNNVMDYFVKDMCTNKQYDRKSLMKSDGKWYSYTNGVGSLLKTNSVVYRTHIQSVGWQEYVKNGTTSGTSGQGLRMEAINIELANSSYPGSGIKYQTHVQAYGWMDWKSNGALSGTSGEAKRLEAIRIKLTGEIANQYDVYYRVHAQHFGWLGWAKNGQSSGTAGYAYRLEAIQIKLVKKGSTSAPVQTAANLAFQNSDGHECEFVLESEQAGTCTERETKTYTCYCGEMKTEQSSTGGAGHKYKETSRREATCAEEGEIIRTCTVCKDVQVEVLPLIEHVYEVTETKESTCTEEGYSVSVCAVCGDEMTEYVEKIPHIYELTDHGDSTCQEAGYDAYVCTACEDYYVEELPLAEHDLVETDPETEPGVLHCMMEGCDYVYIVADHLCDEGHSFEVIQQVNASCTADGFILRECVVCGEQQEKEILPAGGHSWNTGTISNGVRTSACKVCGETRKESVSTSASVSYRTHVQTYGWQNFVKNGALSGTTGESKRLEGIEIKLTGLKNVSGGITYRVHAQTYGWMNWVSDGKMAGTTGESKRLEAIQIKLTGEMANMYDVYYCVHAQTYGWLNWAKNGDMSGTAGLSKRLEAIEIKLVPKGGKAPVKLGTQTKAFIK